MVAPRRSVVPLLFVGALAAACSGGGSSVSAEQRGAKSSGATASSSAGPSDAAATASASASADAGSAAASTGASASASAALTGSAAPGAPRVEVLQDGGAPRKALRYQLTPGHTATLEIRTEMSMEQRVAEASAPLAGPFAPLPAAPAHTMTMEHKVLSVVPKGWKMSFRTVDIIVDPGPTSAAIQAAMQPLRGFVGGFVIDERGYVHETSMEVPPGLPAAAAQLMEGAKDSVTQLAMPLPEGEVGVGARWRVHQQMMLPNVKLTQEADYELVRVEGTRVHLTIVGTQKGPEGAVAIEVPGFGAATQEEYAGAMSGKTTIDLATGMAEGQLVVDNRVVTGLTQAGQALRVEVKGHVVMTTKSK